MSDDFDWSFPSDQSRASVQENAIRDSLARRARPGERPEELLFDLGLFDEHDFALEIASASERPYAGLRDFIPDPRLFIYLPVPIAIRERVCPLVLIGDSLKLASAFLDPDMSYLERRFPNLSVEIGIAPRSEILEALNRVTELL